MRFHLAWRRLVLALAALLFTTTSAQAQATIDPELSGVFAGLAGGATAQVIVTFHGEGAPAATDLAILKGVGILGGSTMRTLPMVATLATLEQVNALAGNPRVRSVFWNKPLEFYNYDARQLTGVDRLRSDQKVTTRNGGLPVSGQGVGIVINDSGIDAMHPDLQLGKNVVQNVWGPMDKQDLAAVGFQPFIVFENQPNSDNGGSGHGTHVAGTVGGTGQASSGKHQGVAPGARLVGFGSGVALFIWNAIGGFDYAIANQGLYKIRVITNSWGSSGGFNPDHPVNVASRFAAEKRNMVVLFAAGNSGSAPDTHNPYAKAPWVISVAAGEKNGTLADFSSRGTPGGPKTVTSSSGEKITWLDEPAVTAPGVDIVSAKASISDGTPELDNPYYTVMSGTSMATPHVAGIVGLMLEANPLLNPAEVKQILKETATKMPDALPSRAYRSFETGAGQVNAYAAVQKAFDLTTPFGATLNVDGVLGRVDAVPLWDDTFAYSPLDLPEAHKHPFTVEPGTDRIEVDVRFNGYQIPAYGNAGNPLLVDVIDPDGNRHIAFDVFFAIYGTTRLVVAVNNPKPGTWTAEVRSLTPFGNYETYNLLALPDTVHEKITAFFFDPPAIDDIQGHPAQGAIEFSLANGFMALCSKNAFCPNKEIRRAEFAKGFTQFGAIRQSLPFGGGSTFGDVSAGEMPFVEAVAARGAALRDPEFRYAGVMEGNGTSFDPNGKILRADLAKMLVRGVGGDAPALSHTGDVTVLYNGTVYVIADQNKIPAELRGYVHVAINSNMINVRWAIEQGPYDTAPTLKAYFDPGSTVTRADAAVAISRYHTQYFK